MTSPLAMLVSADGWERVRGALDAAGLAVDPYILEHDDRVTHHGEPLPPGAPLPPTSWFGPELFPRGQDEAFLALMLGNPNLQWMQSGRAGFDHPAFRKLFDKGVRLSMSKAPAAAIGEYVLAAVLDHFQRGPERRAAQVAERWQAFPFREVAGSRWLLVGYGEIGREVAVRARALGAHITGVRRSGGSDADTDAMVTPDTMAEALAEADVVVLSVPLTATNDGSFGAPFFAGMKKDALFINVGRGQLLDEPALAAALDSSTPGHAVLDVTRIEPLPAGAWQWRHPRVTLTAHTSAIGSGLIARTDALLVENVRRYVGGAPLLHELSARDFA
ncbi:NAD(P)-dependent oxidoreductase [Polymorphobacter sp.]|uniref:NAD(P)-dependent oxidoreductase n=1 Tax=Polymorphobacter sp. TaxID=1909290 RepID=UPI003F7177E5